MWRRGLVFWAFVVAAFYVYNSFGENTYERKIISCVGLVISYLWILIARSNRNLQNAWLNEVINLEEPVTGELFGKALDGADKILMFGASPFSVTKIYIIITYIIFFSWLLICINTLFIEYFREIIIIDDLYISILLFVSAIILSIFSHIWTGRYSWKKNM